MLVMIKTGVQYKDVADAAEQIKQDNENPTVEKVRQLLGTGSNSTINQHLRTWKFDKSRIEADMPLELLKSVDALMSKAEKHAGERYTKEIRELMAKLSEAQVMIDRQSVSIAELNAKLIDKDNTIDSLVGKNDDLMQRLHECEEALGSQETLNRSLTEQRDALSHEKVSAQNDVIKAKQEADDKLTMMRERQESELKNLQQMHDKAITQINIENKETMHNLRLSHEKIIDELQSRLRELKEEQVSSLASMKETYEATTTHLKELITAMQDKEERLQDKLNKLNNENAIISNENATLKERARTLEERAASEAKVKDSLIEKKELLEKEVLRISNALAKFEK
jgi:chromosome segregation ATPase